MLIRSIFQYFITKKNIGSKNQRYDWETVGILTKSFHPIDIGNRGIHPINDFVFELENILKLITCTARQLALVWFLLVLILDWREHGICLEEQLLKIDRSSSCLSCVIVKVKLGKLGKLWTWNRRRGLQNSC